MNKIIFGFYIINDVYKTECEHFYLTDRDTEIKTEAVVRSCTGMMQMSHRPLDMRIIQGSSFLTESSRTEQEYVLFPLTDIQYACFNLCHVHVPAVSDKHVLNFELSSKMSITHNNLY